MTHLLGPLVAMTIVLPAQTQAQRGEQAVRALLAREVDFPCINDPQMTVEQALMLLSQRYGLNIRINEAAFKATDIPDVLKTPVVEPIAIRARPNVQVDRVLRDVLRRVPVDGLLPFDSLTGNWSVDPWTGQPLNPLAYNPGVAVFVVRPTGIEVTTSAALLAQKLLPEPPCLLTSDQFKRVRRLRNALASELDFPGFDDPKMTLDEALTSLSHRYAVRFTVDEEAFKYESVVDVRKTLVTEAKPIRARKLVQLDLVLRDLLTRVPAPSRAVFIVSPHGIEITTQHFLKYQYLRPEPIAVPTPAQLRRTREIRDTLIRPSQFDGFDDPKMTLEKSLDFMARRYGLRFEINAMAFKYENCMDVEKTPIAIETIPRPAGMILPGKVLELLLARIPVPSRAIFVIRPHGYIEITTRKFVESEVEKGEVPLVPLAL